MQDLKFRRKRRKKPDMARRRVKRSARGNLRFEEKKSPLRFARENAGRRKVGSKGIVLWAVEILIVCMTAVLLVAAFGQRVSTAGDSMAPVLKNGDVLLVNHFIYNIKDPDRGDIIVFRQDKSGHYQVKRVVGLPGETVQIVDGKVLIDGEEPAEDIYVSDIEYAGEAAEPVELGADEFFVMGDNHSSSDDSRLPSIGNIKKEDIFGQAWFIVSPAEDFGFI
ncbi:MAG TPA: signal peptidase I [Candidatus Mediterraneibacter colneyensis]|nr:signal peptidase I [Candidatus Mediterraneibacter colneyensis]